MKGDRMRTILLAVTLVLALVAPNAASQPSSVLQLSSACPARYLYVGQTLWTAHTVTNVSNETLYLPIVVEGDDHRYGCDDIRDGLPPMGHVHCAGPLFVETDDAARGYITSQFVAHGVVGNDYAYSNTTTCVIDHPVRVFVPLMVRGG